MEAKGTRRGGRGKKIQEEVVTAEAEIVEDAQKNGTKRKAPEKKGKGKAPVEEVEVEEKVTVKKGRGGKPTKEKEEVEAVEDSPEEAAPAPAKKGRGKKEVVDKAEEVAAPPAKRGRGGKPAKEEEVKDEETVAAPTRKGRGKQTKEEDVAEEEVTAAPTSKRGRGGKEAAKAPSPKKGKKADEEVEENDENEEEEKEKEKEKEEEEEEEVKPKGKGRTAKKEATATEEKGASPAAGKAAPAKRGRGRKVAATTNDAEDEVKAVASNGITEEKKTVKKGRKKAATPITSEVAVSNGVSEPKKTKTNAKKEEKATKSAGKATKRSLKTIEPGNEPIDGEVKISKKPAKKSKKDEKLENGHVTEDVPKILEKKSATTPKGKLNKTLTDYSNLKFDLDDKIWNLKISSWNIAGLRAWILKGGLEFFDHEKPDIICLQEIKCTEDQLPEEAKHIKGYHPYWLCKPGGYAGVAIYSKVMPMSVNYGLGDDEQDENARLLTAEYEKFYLVCAYVPNAGRKLVTLPKRLDWDEKFQNYLKVLDAKKPVILCGDLNVAHEEIDLKNPKSNKRNAGFTQEERDGMTQMLSLGFVDTFRKFYPDTKDAYTFWTYMGNSRSKNVGWRLDYFIASERLTNKTVDNVIRTGVYGSDHCPITLFLNL